MDTLKQFVGVFFDESRWEVIPKNWLIDQNGLKCYWPPVNVKELAQQSAAVDKKRWSLWPVDRVQETSNDYGRTERKMVQGTETASESEDRSGGELLLRHTRLTMVQGTATASESEDRSGGDMLPMHTRPTIESPRQSPRIKKMLGKSTDEKRSSISNTRRSLFNPLVSQQDESSSSDDDATTVHIAQQPIQLATTSKFNPTSNIPQCSTSADDNLICAKYEVQVAAKIIAERNLKVSEENNILLRELLMKMSSLAPACIEVPRTVAPHHEPADTVEQLELLVNDKSVVVMLLQQEDHTLSKTVANIAKKLMTRHLAMQFSMTGLGKNRQRNQIRFKNTSACRLIEHVLKEIPRFKDIMTKDVAYAISVALKNALDWDGRRGNRQLRLVNAQGETPPVADLSSDGQESSQLSGASDGPGLLQNAMNTLLNI